jgi:hypothetical protein
MATKTFKIGEYSRGGVITAEVKKNKVTVIFKNWDFSKGSTKSSDQSQAPEYNRIEVDATSSGAEGKLLHALWDDTSSYYSEIVLAWIKTKVKFVPTW